MDSFLDSNVILNYIFRFDKHHVESQYIIFKSKSYYSSNVKKEVDNVFINKNREYKSFLLCVDSFVNKFSDYDLINQDDVLKYIGHLRDMGNFDIVDMYCVLEKIWNELEFNQTHDAFDVKLKIAYLIKEFQYIHQFRKDSIYKNMNLVPNHTKKDRKILEKIKENDLRDGLLHAQDEDILFDANEFCKYNPEIKLKFVSADQDFVKAINILMEYLCLDECINLLEFSNN